jgi:hypothetical protein
MAPGTCGADLFFGFQSGPNNTCGSSATTPSADTGPLENKEIINNFLEQMRLRISMSFLSLMTSTCCLNPSNFTRAVRFIFTQLEQHRKLKQMRQRTTTSEELVTSEPPYCTVLPPAEALVPIEHVPLLISPKLTVCNRGDNRIMRDDFASVRVLANSSKCGLGLSAAVPAIDLLHDYDLDESGVASAIEPFGEKDCGLNVTCESPLPALKQTLDTGVARSSTPFCELCPPQKTVRSLPAAQPAGDWQLVASAPCLPSQTFQSLLPGLLQDDMVAVILYCMLCVGVFVTIFPRNIVGMEGCGISPTQNRGSSFKHSDVKKRVRQRILLTSIINGLAIDD